MNDFIIGHVYNTGNKLFIVVNKQGTIENLPSVKWYALLWLEIRQGFNKPLSLAKLREYCYKYRS